LLKEKTRKSLGVRATLLTILMREDVPASAMKTKDRSSHGPAIAD